MASWTSHFGQLINEVRGYVSAEHTDAGGFLALPEARVHVTSDLPDSIRGIATLTFGGNHAFPQHTDNTTAEVREEVSGLSQDATHRIKLRGYLNSVRLRANQTPNQLRPSVVDSLDAVAGSAGRARAGDRRDPARVYRLGGADTQLGAVRARPDDRPHAVRGHGERRDDQPAPQRHGVRSRLRRAARLACLPRTAAAVTGGVHAHRGRELRPGRAAVRVPRSQPGGDAAVHAP